MATTTKAAAAAAALTVTTYVRVQAPCNLFEGYMFAATVDIDEDEDGNNGGTKKKTFLVKVPHDVKQGEEFDVPMNQNNNPNDHYDDDDDATEVSTAGSSKRKGSHSNSNSNLLWRFVCCCNAAPCCFPDGCCPDGCKFFLSVVFPLILSSNETMLEFVYYSSILVELTITENPLSLSPRTQKTKYLNRFRLSRWMVSINKYNSLKGVLYFDSILFTSAI
jgi:hypothetical protein